MQCDIGSEVLGNFIRVSALSLGP